MVERIQLGEVVRKIEQKQQRDEMTVECNVKPRWIERYGVVELMKVHIARGPLSASSKSIGDVNVMTYG